MTEPSVCSGDEAVCQISLITCCKGGYPKLIYTMLKERLVRSKINVVLPGNLTPNSSSVSHNRLIELWFYVSLDKNTMETFPKPISWLGMEKINLTQQKHTLTNQKKCIPTQNKHKTTKARFSRLLRHKAWKWRGPIVVFFHKFVTYLLT